MNRTEQRESIKHATLCLDQNAVMNEKKIDENVSFEMSKLTYTN